MMITAGLIAIFALLALACTLLAAVIKEQHDEPR